MAELRMQPVTNSSNIDAVGHDGDGLVVHFKSGGRYHYPGLEPHHVEAILTAPSAGKHVNGLIKGREFTKLGAPEAKG